MTHERISRPRIALGAAWLIAITTTSVGALVHRPAFAETQSSGAIFLVVFGLPAIVLAVTAIRTPAILIATAILAGTWTCVTSWETMRETGSTAAIGVGLTPALAVFIVGIASVLDAGFRIARRRADTARMLHDARRHGS